MIHSKSKGTKLIIGLLAAILALCVCCVMLISNGKSNVGVAYAESTAVETTDTTTTTESTTEETEIDYSTMFEWKINYYNNSISITKYIGSNTEVVVPTFINKMPVEIIQDGAFKNCTNVKSIKISEGIKYIYNSVFYGCNSLTNVELAKSIISIGSHVFYNCTSLTCIDIPNSVTSVGESAFGNCTSLISIKLSEGITNELDSTFKGCSSLESIVIPKNISSISRTFDNCTKLTGVVFQEGSQLNYIGDYVFRNCINLNSFVIPSNVTKISSYGFADSGFKNIVFAGDEQVINVGQYAFSNCKNLTSINLGNNTIIFDQYAYNGFSNCTSLTGVYISSIESWCKNVFNDANSNPLYYAKNLYFNNELVTDLVIPEGVAEINNYVFYNCDNLINVNISNTVTTIGERAFCLCDNLASIYIPKSVIEIKSGAFIDCDNLINVNISFLASWCNIIFSEYRSNPLYYAKNLYLDNELVTDLVIPEGIEKINNYTFYGCTSLINVEIPNSVTSIGSHVFYQCTSLTSIDIPNSVTSIGYSAFYGCTGLESVRLSEGISNIDNYTFTNCKKLINIVVPKGVSSIGDSAFYGCTGLISVTLPSTLTSVASNAFYGCTSLTGVYITSLVSWCNIAFSTSASNPLTCAKSLYLNGVLVTELSIPEGVEKINDYVFYGVKGLTSVKLPEGVTSIGNYTFSNCSNIINIEIPKSVMSIGRSAFSNCSSLESIEIPEGVTSIGEYTFSYCTNLTKIVIPESLTNIKESAFNQCRSIDIYITSIEKWCSVEIKSTPFGNGGKLFLNNELVTKLVIPEGIIVVKNFVACTSLTEVILPEGVESISFSGCTNLEIINLPEGIKDIYFYNCQKLKSIDIPNSLTNIGGYCFGYCYNLTSIDIPDGVTTIGDQAFYYCTNLSSIKIPESVTNMGNAVFNYCNIKSVKLPSKITNLGGFYWCRNLESINIPEGVTKINGSEFAGCYSLTNITIHKNITIISDKAFHGCSSLKTVYIDNADLASNVTSYSAQGYLFSANSSYGARQAIAVIGENPTVGSYITDNYANTEVITYNGNTYTVYSTHEQAWELDYKIEPDCVNDGFEQYVCDTCGLVKNNVIPATGHTESEWIVDINATTDCAGHKYIECTVCKEVLLEEEIPALGVVVDEEINYQHSCSFHNNLTLNFYIPAEDLNKYDSFYLFVEQDIYANGIWGVQSFEIRKSELTSNGYKFVFTGIGAADAGNEIRATLYAQLGDVQYKSLVDVYSVKTYAYNRLAKSTDAQFKTLLVDMLNYCSAAQVYFGVNTDNLVNADLTEEQKALATATDSTVADTSSTVALEGATAQIKAKSIVFNSNIEVKFYMDLSGYQDLTDIALRITYTDGLGVTHVTVVESTEFVYEKSQESYTAKLIDLNSAELRAQIQVEIMLDEQVISDTLYYSVETYVYNRLNKSTDENFKALLKVLMKYSDSANKYFYKGGN